MTITTVFLNDIISGHGYGVAPSAVEAIARKLLEAEQMISGYEKAAADKRRLTRELDVLLNGENAAEQASLCDIVAQVSAEGIKLAAREAVPPGYKLVPNEPTESMVIDGFESDAFLSLADAVNEAKGWPYSCAEAAECVTGIFKAMIAGVPAVPEVSQ